METTRLCAFLSMDSLEGFFVYDDLVHPPLADAGWAVEEVSWRAEGVDWSRFDAVVIRSPWDYQDEPEAFLRRLEEIDEATRLANSIELVRWNLDKGYLRDLESRGVRIVPSLWPESFDLDEVLGAFDRFGVPGRHRQIVLKPRVSANADHTYLLTEAEARARGEDLAEVFAERPFLVQPFAPAIVDEGEFSLFFFGGRYSHAILKRPEANDFRVQEEHGGRLLSVEVEPALCAQAERTLAAIPGSAPLYARLDFVRMGPTEGADTFAVMEVEAIEPSLYFQMDPASPQRFADAFVERFGRG